MKATYIGYGNSHVWGVHDFLNIKKIIVKTHDRAFFRIEVKNGALMLTVPQNANIDLQVVGPGRVELAGSFNNLKLGVEGGVTLDASLAKAEFQYIAKTQADVFIQAFGKVTLEELPVG